MLNIDDFAYRSKLKKKDPIEKILFSLITLGVCIWADEILISVIVMCVMGWVSVYKGGTPLFAFVKLLLLPMAFLIIGVATIAITYSTDKTAFLISIPSAKGYMGATALGLSAATNLFFKALGASSCLYYLSLSTPLVDLLHACIRIKVPKLMVELMGLIYRFIFVLLETAEKIYTGQNSRLGYSSLRAGYRSMGTLVASLFIRAYKRSDELYTALEARGYDGELNVLHEPFERDLKGQIFTFALNVVLILLTFLLKSNGMGGLLG